MWRASLCTWAQRRVRGHGGGSVGTTVGPPACSAPRRLGTGKEPGSGGVHRCAPGPAISAQGASMLTLALGRWPASRPSHRGCGRREGPSSPQLLTALPSLESLKALASFPLNLRPSSCTLLTPPTPSPRRTCRIRRPSSGKTQRSPFGASAERRGRTGQRLTVLASGRPDRAGPRPEPGCHRDANRLPTSFPGAGAAAGPGAPRAGSAVQRRAPPPLQTPPHPYSRSFHGGGQRVRGRAGF